LTEWAGKPAVEATRLEIEGWLENVQARSRRPGYDKINEP